MCASARGVYPPARNESKGASLRGAEVGSRLGAPPTDHAPSGKRFECEHICWDPKDGELCLSRVKPGETLVEARSDSNVQIDRRTWV
jgi:hypothetical protein